MIDTLIDRLCAHADAALKEDMESALCSDLNEAISVLRHSRSEIPSGALIRESLYCRGFITEDIDVIFSVIGPYLRNEPCEISSGTLIALLRAMVEEREIGHEIKDDGQVLLDAQDVYAAIRAHASNEIPGVTPSEIPVIAESVLWEKIGDAIIGSYVVQNTKTRKPQGSVRLMNMDEIINAVMKEVRPYLRQPVREIVSRAGFQLNDKVYYSSQGIGKITLPESLRQKKQREESAHRIARRAFRPDWFVEFDNGNKLWLNESELTKIEGEQS